MAVAQESQGGDFLTALRNADLGDAFWMYQFKVLPCPHGYRHSWTHCPFAHIGETARRRCPRTFNYLPDVCPHAKAKRPCPAGEACPYSHNTFEQWLHPTRYRTRLCYLGATCRRPTCFFAHSVEELRHVEGSDTGDVGSVGASESDSLGAQLALMTSQPPGAAALLATPPPLLPPPASRATQAANAAAAVAGLSPGMPMAPMPPALMHAPPMMTVSHDGQGPNTSAFASAQPNHFMPYMAGPMTATQPSGQAQVPYMQTAAGRARSQSMPGDGLLGYGRPLPSPSDAALHLGAAGAIYGHAPTSTPSSMILSNGPRHTPLPSNRSPAFMGVAARPRLPTAPEEDTITPTSTPTADSGMPRSAAGPDRPSFQQKLAQSLVRNASAHQPGSSGPSSGDGGGTPRSGGAPVGSSALGRSPSTPGSVTGSGAGPSSGEQAYNTAGGGVDVDSSTARLASLLSVLRVGSTSSNGAGDDCTDPEVFAERSSDPGPNSMLIRRISSEMSSSGSNAVRNSDPGQVYGSDMVGALLPLLQTILNEGLATGQFELVNGQLQLTGKACRTISAPPVSGTGVPMVGLGSSGQRADAVSGSGDNSPIGSGPNSSSSHGAQGIMGL